MARSCRLHLLRSAAAALLLPWFHSAGPQVTLGGDVLPGPGPGRVHGRHVHWVLRTSDLKRSVDFYQEVFGMKVLRHEENPESCPITCNGEYSTAWSKTMVGYETEDKAYALELTFNYGVTSYEKGEALADIAVRLRRPLLEALAGAGRLGYGPAETNGTSMHLTGPDGYRYLLLMPAEEDEEDGGSAGGQAAPAEEPFDHVRLRVSDLDASVAFYTHLLGMSEHTKPARKRAEPSAAYMRGVRVVGYGAPGNGRSSVPLFLEQSPAGGRVRVEQWEGRHAVALPAEELRTVYAAFRDRAPHLVVHELRELEEKLGTLLIAIVRDPDGLEICLVSSEVFDQAASAADDFAPPDWRQRRALAAERAVQLTSADAAAGNRPLWSLEETIAKNPEAYRRAEEQVEREFARAQEVIKSGDEFMARAKKLLDAGDFEALKAMDWGDFEEGQKFLAEWTQGLQPKGREDALEDAKARVEEQQDQARSLVSRGAKAAAAADNKEEL